MAGGPRPGGAQEGGDRDGSVVLVRRRRHVQPCIVGEQRNHAVNVADGQGLREAPGR